MSAQAKKWARAQDHVDRGAAAKLLDVLAWKADEHGVFWDGVKAIAREARCTDRTVTRNLDLLEEAGLVLRVRRFRKNGSRTTDYVILAPGVERGTMAPIVGSEKYTEAKHPYLVAAIEAVNPAMGGVENDRGGRSEATGGSVSPKDILSSDQRTFCHPLNKQGEQTTTFVEGPRFKAKSEDPTFDSLDEGFEEKTIVEGENYYSPESVERIFDHSRGRLLSSGATLTPRREKAIAHALRKRPESDLLDAVDCLADALEEGGYENDYQRQVREPSHWAHDDRIADAVVGEFDADWFLNPADGEMYWKTAIPERLSPRAERTARRLAFAASFATVSEEERDDPEPVRPVLTDREALWAGSVEKPVGPRSSWSSTPGATAALLEESLGLKAA